MEGIAFKTLDKVDSMRLEMPFSEGKLKGPYILCGDNTLGVQWFHF